jgi:ribose transport system substrate-binding protein
MSPITSRVSESCRGRSRTIPAIAAGVVTTVLALTGCSGPATDAGAGAAANSDGHLQIAFLSASSANTWLASSKAAMDAVAEDNDATVTEFDGQFKPAEQSKQIQDIITSGRYQGLVIASVDGAGVIPELERAQKAGIKVAILNQVIGTDLSTPDPQFDGPVVSVLAPPVRTGEGMGTLTTQACTGKPDCKVVYLYGIKGTPIDNAEREGFDSVISKTAGISVVAEGEAGYLGTDGGRKAVADVLQRIPNPDVIVGVGDQGIQGAALALSVAGVTGTKLIGVGGSEAAIAGIKNGSWFGDVFGAPAGEGRLALTELISGIRNGTTAGGIDTASTLPEGGLVTSNNVNEFTAEWTG